MSGHSKWSTIKHRKGAQDAKRSKVFTKIIREISAAARVGGDDASSNPRLRLAISLAKQANMPLDNVKRAIQKGMGGDKGESWENIVYEGYGPHQVAVIVECLTDNRNRTISSIRTVFNKLGGNMGATNSVLYMFDRKGLIQVPKKAIGEDALLELVLEAGAEDLDSSDDEVYEVKTEPSDFSAVLAAIEEEGLEVAKSGVELIPQNTIEISEVDKAKQVFRFIDALEDDDDVQNVYSNLELSPEVMAALEEE